MFFCKYLYILIMKTLIIIPSQTRGFDSTYSSFKKHILDKNSNIDIGLFVSDESDLSIIPNYKHHFTLPEYSDHREGLIHELNYLNQDIPNSLTEKKKLDNYQISTA